METTKTPLQVLPDLLTEMRAPQTPKPSVNTMDWAKFLSFQIKGSEKDQAQLKAMVDEAARFIKAIKANAKPYWLSFLGMSGIGKTYLVRQIWRWYKQSSFFKSTVDMQSKEIIYAGSWCNWLRLASDLLGNSGYGELEDLRTEKLVVLDEIGADRDPSGHVRDCLVRLLSGRSGKWTLITSNKSLGEIQRDIDTRLSSRMLRDGSVVLDLDITDYALR